MVRLFEFFLPGCSPCSPVKPRGHKHLYCYPVNPLWQEPPFLQGDLSQAFFREEIKCFKLRKLQHKLRSMIIPSYLFSTKLGVSILASSFYFNGQSWRVKANRYFGNRPGTRVNQEKLDSFLVWSDVLNWTNNGSGSIEDANFTNISYQCRVWQIDAQQRISNLNWVVPFCPLSFLP